MVRDSPPRVSRHLSVELLPTVVAEVEQRWAGLDSPDAKRLRRSVSSPTLSMPVEVAAGSQFGKSAIPPAPPLPNSFNSTPRAFTLQPRSEPLSVTRIEALQAMACYPSQSDASSLSTVSLTYSEHGMFGAENCSICYEEVMSARPGVSNPTFCCGQVACQRCMEHYVRGKVSSGYVRITCPAAGCTTQMPEGDVRNYLDRSEWDRFERLLIIKDAGGNVHLCPNCSKVTHAPEDRRRKRGTSVTCTQCSFNWCFECESRWHPRATCRTDNKNSSAEFRAWLKARVRDTPNAQRCPKCKIPIQRSSGCNNMTCSKCHTSFCYRCGDRQHDMFFIGDHHSRLSVLGCKYNFKPDQPLRRKAIRGSLLFAGVTLGVPLCIGGGAVVLAGVIAISPFYGTYKILRNAKDRL